MEKVLIEQLLNNGVSLKKIKSIIENTEKAKEDLNETISANTCGLKLMVCSGCHKTMYEDKFMLNKMNKRYRSCINCVSRARIARQNKDKDKQKTILKDKDNVKILAILDKEYNDEETNDNNNNNNNNNDKNNNIYPFPYPIEKQEDIIEKQKDIIEKDIIVKPSNDKPKTKSKKKINNNNNYSILERKIEPEELKLIFFNLFN